MIIKCRNWEITITKVGSDGYMHGWLEYVGATIPSFGTCMGFWVNDKKVIATDFPEYIPKYLHQKLLTEYAKMTKSHK